jgi:hypothetical protein
MNLNNSWNLATALRRARNRAMETGPGPKSRLAQLIFLVKEHMQKRSTELLPTCDRVMEPPVPGKK